MEAVLISACLLGMNCRYDGTGGFVKDLDELKDKYQLIPVCPEQFGGLPTPRVPAEIQNGRVINQKGEDVSGNYKKGAEETLKLARFYGCRYALLKERSPSCGCGEIYNGAFSKTLTPGNGITAALLLQNGVQVFGESEYCIDLSHGFVYNKNIEIGNGE